MLYNIRLAQAEDYPRIMEIWESAVKATIIFYRKKDFVHFKEVIPKNISRILMFI